MTALQILQFLFSGLAVGGLYALIAVGFVTIYNVTGIINFAQGEFAMVGAMVAATLNAAGLNLLPAVLCGICAAAAVGVLAQRLALHPARHSPAVAQIMITIGLSIALRGAALMVWGSEPKTLLPFSAGGPIAVGSAVFARQDLWVLVLTLLAMTLLFLFFEKTTAGAALRAAAMNRDVSRLVGIAPPRMALLAFAMSAALAGLAGTAAAPTSLATYDMGLMLGLKGFVAAVMGGLNNPVGAVAGAFLLGSLESLSAGLISSGYKDAVAFLVLLLVLLLRPGGLFARASGQRV